MDAGPGRLSRAQWKAVAIEVWSRFIRDNISIIAGGISFNIVLSIFPAMAAFVALYGLVADVDAAARNIAQLRVLLPSDAVKIIGVEMVRLAGERRGGLSLTLGISVVVSLWSASGAMRAMIVGLNAAYGVNEKRGFFRLTLITLAFTLGLLAFLGIVVFAMAAEGFVATFLGRQASWLLYLLRWPLLMLFSAGGLCLLYRFGPCRPFARWRWITWGSGAATVVWLGASVAFSVYLSHFAHLGRTYGSLATAIGLMLWIWLSAAIVLAGAELNAEIERNGGPYTLRPADALARPRGPQS